jgi:hypothetical protein
MTIMLSVWTVLIWNPMPLAAMLAVELVLIGYAGQAGKLVRPILGLSMVATFFALIQLPFDISLSTAIASGLKMMVMTVAFLLLSARPGFLMNTHFYLLRHCGLYRIFWPKAKPCGRPRPAGVMCRAAIR